MSDCLFCGIISKKITTKYVGETSELIAIRDVNPQAPVHILIIPKKHISTLNDITKEDCNIIGEVHMFVKEIAKKEGIAEDGYRLVLNTNRGAGQSVFHIHWHLLGGRVFNWPPG
ncbi:MAG TPA: histidine triad nucleotide-binding protein [Elusimicrobia bacterium]|nr:MAG: histidine triad nucleotide-binding protein [Elusimicrobia bacterium RIFOXYD2_FULL_34_30]HAM38749.1 histidine triad nucleotide-binding protein [Elusimicrobiota bacterium]